MTTEPAASFPVLSQHLRREREVHPALTYELSALLQEIALVGKILARDVGRAILTGRVGYTGDVNVQGEPLGMVVEQAGGKASTGTQRILDLVPGEFHQRVPLFIGSAEEVERAEALHSGARL